MRIRLATALLSALLFVQTAPVRAAAPATTLYVPFSEVGFQREIVLGRGGARTFTVFFPVFPELRSATLVLPMKISPIVDPKSSIAVSVQGVPVYTQSVRTLGLRPKIEVAIPFRPKLDAGGLQITISAHLFTLRERCEDDSDPNFWATIDPSGGWRIVTDPGPPTDLADWFQSYDRHIAVVVPPNASDGLRYAAPRLAYALQKIPRWRSLALTMTDRDQPRARNMLLVGGPPDMRLQGNTVAVTPGGVALIRPTLVRSLQTKTVADATIDPPTPNPATKELTLSKLGMGDVTQSGTSEDISFAIPFQVADVRGLPEDLVFNLGLNHSITSNERR
ncbi:MAG: cellulose biosynthesis cyclic di-GMP-binding regulatory protein BcsB, partial [Candidatus Eremiobacteraeota bacterium]|nr:cellulose biosynthesis cyclic di-GMP-binding regulatory protein BcsB [Candidatus Eremiobacteraeota bacterium]